MTSASASHPLLGLGVAGLGLDPGEGVERRHQRQVELVLEAVPGDARQPVVGVQGVDAAAGPDVGEHAVGELVDQLGERLLGDVGGAGGDVHDPEPGLDVDDVGQLVVPAADVDRAGHAGLGERGRQLAHVDVHAAGVARARLGERRGVQGEDGQRAHDGAQRYRTARTSRSGARRR